MWCGEQEVVILKFAQANLGDLMRQEECPIKHLSAIMRSPTRASAVEDDCEFADN